MPHFNIIRESPIKRSARVAQTEGMFDLSAQAVSREAWQIDVDLPEDWLIGAIVGPSGSGKTTIARVLFPNRCVIGYGWDPDRSILDGFPVTLSIKDITKSLSSVGFSSPPAWLRPFHVLSTGEQFRVTVARALLENESVTVIDEFTSVVDRTVAKIGSAAIAKAVRRSRRKFVAVSCHYDILEWLEPDWVFEPHLNRFQEVRLRRPKISISIFRVHHSAWEMFRKYHYLNTTLNKSSVCFCAYVEGVAVAFGAYLHFPHPRRKNIKRAHRTVCLPDYQGVGIGNALSNWIGQYCLNRGYAYQSQTSHPAMVTSRNQSRLWKLKGRSGAQTMPSHVSLGHAAGQTKGTRRRFQYTFEYVGNDDDVY